MSRQWPLPETVARSSDTFGAARERVLATASLFPLYEDMVIDGLTDDEEVRFLAAIAGE